MNIKILVTVLLSSLLLYACRETPEKTNSIQTPAALRNSLPTPAIPFAPRQYICYKTSGGLLIDGLANEPDWQKAAWTEDFVDIEGNARPAPRYRTRVKMLWDETFLYISAELEEPDVWATLKQRDTVIFYDNDFEIFIDPGGDTHQYYEFEMNAFGTFWDLLLIKPYRDGGPAVNAWDIKGAKVSARVFGTLNDPVSKDEKWTVEVALPWEILKECAPGGKLPGPGDQWRINFSRVEWDTEVMKGAYHVRTSPVTGKRLPESNWVWSPQGLVNMHYPEMWGVLQFSQKTVGEGKDTWVPDPDAMVKWQLRKLYYKQRNYFSINGRYATVLKELGINNPDEEGFSVVPEIQTTNNLFEITLPGSMVNESWHIRQDGKIWSD